MNSSCLFIHKPYDLKRKRRTRNQKSWWNSTHGKFSKSLHFPPFSLSHFCVCVGFWLTSRASLAHISFFPPPLPRLGFFPVFLSRSLLRSLLCESQKPGATALLYQQNSVIDRIASSQTREPRQECFPFEAFSLSSFRALFLVRRALPAFKVFCFLFTLHIL